MPSRSRGSVSYTHLSLPTSDKRERSIYVISDLLRKELDRIPEVREYSVMPGGDNGSMSGSATVDIKVFGYDMDVTNAVANDPVSYTHLDVYKRQA